MRLFLIHLALSLASSEKLDRTYLPPLGSKYAGGSYEDIQPPLEFVKETYPVKEKSGLNGAVLEDPQLLGIDRKFPIHIPIESFQELGGVIPEVKYPPYFPETIEEDFKTKEGSLNLGFDLQTQVPNYSYSSNEEEAEIRQNANILDNPSTQRPGNLVQTPNYGYDGQSNLNQHVHHQPIQTLVPGTIRDLGVVQPIFDHHGLIQATMAQLINSNNEHKPFGVDGGSSIVKTSESFPKHQIVTQGDGQSSDKSGLPSHGHMNLSKIGNDSNNMPRTTNKAVEVPIETGFVDASFPSKIDSYNKETIRPVTVNDHPITPQANADRRSVTVNYKNVITPEGFAFSFDTSNGIHADENGTTKDGVKAQGAYSYVGDDGKFYEVIYSADENGFQPRGNHLPTPPPIPEAIQRVIEQAAREKDAGIFNDGSYDETKYGHERYQGAMNRYNSLPFQGLRSKGRERRPIITNGDVAPVNKLQDKFDDFHISDKTHPNNRLSNRRPSKLLPQQGKEMSSEIGNSQAKGYNSYYANENALRPHPVSFNTKQTVPEISNSLTRQENGGDSVENSNEYENVSDEQKYLNEYNRPLPVRSKISPTKFKIDRISDLSELTDFNNRNHLNNLKPNDRTYLSATKFNESENPQRIESFYQNDDSNVFTTNDPNMDSFISNVKQGIQKSFNQLHGINSDNNEESRYQYLPPKNKFSQNRLPLHISANEDFTTISPLEYETTNPIVKPDVYIHDDKIQDRVNNDFQIKKKPDFNNVESGASNNSSEHNFNDIPYPKYGEGLDIKVDYEITTSPKYPVSGMVYKSQARRPSNGFTQQDLTQEKYFIKPHALPKGTLASEQNGVNRNIQIESEVPQIPVSFLSPTTPIQKTPFGSKQSPDESLFKTTVPEFLFHNIEPTANSQVFSRRPETSPLQNKPAVSSNTVNDKTESNTPLGINVDGFGRPIPTSEAVHEFFGLNTTYGAEYAPIELTEEGGSVQDIGIISRPFDSNEVNAGSNTGISEDPIRLEDGTGTYPSGVKISNEMIIGEDFSGPKQPQRYDPETGYHYK